MHYTVEFTGTRDQKTVQAQNATKSYLGARYYQLRLVIAERFKVSKRKGIMLTRMVCMFNGVGGYYPYRALSRDAYKLSKTL